MQVTLGAWPLSCIWPLSSCDSEARVLLFCLGTQRARRCSVLAQLGLRASAQRKTMCVSGEVPCCRDSLCGGWWPNEGGGCSSLRGSSKSDCGWLHQEGGLLPVRAGDQIQAFLRCVVSPAMESLWVGASCRAVVACLVTSLPSVPQEA